MTWEEFFALRPPFKVCFWADGDSLGEITFREEPFGQTLSQFFYCHVCKEVWGMIEYPNRHWTPVHVTCRRHQDERSAFCLPGSMLDSVSPLDSYPEAFIRREFELHMQYYEKESASWQNP